MEEDRNAAKLVSAAILGKELRFVEVNGKVYPMQPPTIHKLAGAAYYLADLADEESKVSEVLYDKDRLESTVKALSYLIDGSERLWEELAEGTMEEIVGGIETAYSLVGVRDFTVLLTLARNASRLTAQQRL